MKRGSRRVELLSAFVAFLSVLGGCGDDTSEPEVRGPQTEEERVEAFCSPLQFDPESTDPTGDLARRAVAVVDNSGTGADADEAAGTFVQNTDNAPAEIRDAAQALGDAVSEALSTGDTSAIETSEAERAIADINTWAMTMCLDPTTSTVP